MKASLKFRDEQKPLFRAKVPLNILGFPFQSGISAGDSKEELSLNLSTFFESGPSLKIVYRPNDSWNPFSLVVKTGIGSFGSPNSTPLAMSTEFSLLGNGNPRFFVQFRPQIGDFSIKKSVGSSIDVQSQSLVFAPKIKPTATDLDSEADESVNGGATPFENGVYRPDNNLFTARKLNGFFSGNNTVNAIDNLFNGVEVSARTVLPVRSHAVLKFRWGFRFPGELKSALTDDGISNPTSAISLRKIPILVMSKIAIEHITEEVSKDSSKRDLSTTLASNSDVAETCLAVRRQLEVLQVENGLLRKAMEDLRSDIGAGKLGSVAGSKDSGKFRDTKRNGGKYLGGKIEADRQSSDWEASEFGKLGGKVKDGAVMEELKKA